MSIKIINSVWDSDLKPNLKAVATAYADFADDDGKNIYPSVERMAYKTNYTPRQIQRLTKQLLGMGILISIGKHPTYGTNEYALVVENLPKKPPFNQWLEEQENRESEPQNRESEEGGGDKMSPPDKMSGGVTFEPFRGDKMSPDQSLDQSYNNNNAGEAENTEPEKHLWVKTSKRKRDESLADLWGFLIFEFEKTHQDWRQKTKSIWELCRHTHKTLCLPQKLPIAFPDHRQKINTDWFIPAIEILGFTGWDLQQAKILVSQAISEIAGIRAAGKTNFIPTSPKNLLKNITATIAAKRQTPAESKTPTTTQTHPLWQEITLFATGKKQITHLPPPAAHFIRTHAKNIKQQNEFQFAQTRKLFFATIAKSNQPTNQPAN